MHRRGWRPVLPIYTFLLIWLLCSLFAPLLRLSALLASAVLAIAGAAGIFSLLRRSVPASVGTPEEAKTAHPAEQSAPSAVQQPAEPAYPPEVSAIISDGRVALREMGRLRSSITDQEVKAKINAIMEISDKIIRDAIDDPADVPQIRHFLDFYLPTTLKLLNAYDRMDSLGVEGDNISGSKQRIGDMLDATLEACRKQLDSLFANQALDIDAEIRAMSSMLAQEGMGGALDWKAFKRDYDMNNDNRKGTTDNG